MIEVKDLVLSYGRKIALKDINLSVKPGERLGLIGENGAGKTTLLKAIVGLNRVKSGTLSVNGDIGWMADNSSPTPGLKVEEFLSYIGSLKGVYGIDSVIDQCELSSWRGSYCRELSKGIKQRVLLAAAIIGKPDILILDEPSSGLDPKFQKKMINIIDSISKDITLIISTHNITEIESLTNRVVVIDKGEISYDGDFKGVNSYYEEL